MKPKAKTLEYFDWYQDIEPLILDKLDELLAKEGTDPVSSMHGGYWKDGKWVSVGEGEYRNFWHVWLSTWGQELKKNDSFDKVVWYSDEEEWKYTKECVTEEYGPWAVTFVNAVREVVEENNWYDKEITIWYSW